MQSFLVNLSAALERENVVIVRVLSIKGSVPREVGAMMAITASAQIGTIGGGRLEWDAAAHAREKLAQTEFTSEAKRYALGPSLGQCCGGMVELAFEAYSKGDIWPVLALSSLIDGKGYEYPSKLTEPQASLTLHAEPFHISLFGGGHVGRALVNAFAALPCRVSWVDSRDEIFPDQLPANLRAEHSAPVQAAVHDMSVVEVGSHVLIMSFSHAEDLDIVAACLDRQRKTRDLKFIGLIGSKTKWATFQARLRERGYSQDELAKVTCPIGIGNIKGKEPAVIALAVAAQLMSLLSG